MKLIILRSNLKEALGAVERAVVENNNLPILKSILLKADTRVTVQATNLEIGVTCQTNAKITEPGSLAIPLAPLLSIIQNSVSERIVLESAGSTLTVKTDNYEAKIQGVSAEEFPIIPALEEGGSSLEMSSDIFKSAMGEVAGAAATNDLKPELNSVLFCFEEGAFKIAATDGFRLAEKTFGQNTFAASGAEPIKALVPLKTVYEAVRIFEDGEQLTLSFDDHQVLFKAKDTTLISRLVDGQYPEYGAIIPKQTSVELTADREQLFSAVKLVSNFSGKGSDVHLRISSEHLEIFAASQAVGENAYQVPIKKKRGDSVKEMVFNWRYLLDGLKALPGGTVTIGITSESKPALLQAADDDSIFYIVMPIQQ